MLWMEICEFDIAIQGSTMGYNKKSGGGGGGGGPAPFLVKTYEMVEERETNEVISWGEKGKSFVVWKPAEFARDLLPRHFKHNNFSSFVRQLNTYGFKKVMPDRWEFTNDNFRRGEQSLLCNIQRRKPPASSTSRLRPDVKPSACHKYDDNNNNHIHLQHSSTSNSGELQSTSSASSPPPPPLLPPPYPLPTHLRELANENEKLRKDNRILTAELSQVKCYLHELIGYLSEYVDVSKLDLSLQPGAELSEGMNEKEGGEGEATAAERKDGIKLFGVMLLRSFEDDGGKTHGGGKKRRCDGGGCSDGCGHQKRPLKMRFALPWMGISTPVQQGSSKVCR